MTENGKCLVNFICCYTQHAIIALVSKRFGLPSEDDHLMVETLSKANQIIIVANWHPVTRNVMSVKVAKN